MRIYFLLVAVLLAIPVIWKLGSYNKPDIPGYHWSGSVLYDSSGRQVASVVTFPSFVDASQDCINLASGKPIGCSYWENGQLAYDDVARVFAGAGSTKVPENQ